jgi:hypothetical protein
MNGAYAMQMQAENDALQEDEQLMNTLNELGDDSDDYEEY